MVILSLLFITAFRFGHSQCERADLKSLLARNSLYADIGFTLSMECNLQCDVRACKRSGQNDKWAKIRWNKNLINKI